MLERIDFALGPGVVLSAVLFFVLINALIAAAVYPYFQDDTAPSETQTTDREAPKDFMEGASSDPETLERRVDEFIADMESRSG
ncbi:MAG: hypothetical protein ABEL97_10225 [Salinibacter sp.]